LNEYNNESSNDETLIEFKRKNDTKWEIDYSHHIISIKERKSNNEIDDWVTIDEYGVNSNVKYYKLLENDDLILITTYKYIIILSFNNKTSKIYCKCITKKDLTKNEIKSAVDNDKIEEYLFNINSMDFNYSYVHKHQITRQPYREMILY
ncbi:7253_t:CDS:1, partial [Entrophospora sp. SA101]